jgi:hypothetical protein
LYVDLTRPQSLCYGTLISTAYNEQGAHFRHINALFLHLRLTYGSFYSAGTTFDRGAERFF